jgi:microcompartment protein CcmL/EutN
MGSAEPVLPAVEPALALLELDSIAAGIEAGDAMAKRAPIDVIRAGTVHPGKFLVLVGGSVGDVEEALAAGREVGASSVLDAVLLPNVHPELVDAIRGVRRSPAGEALGIIETATVAAILEAADAGLKGARVHLLELRLADDLGGKGYLLFDGAVADVEAAVEIGAARIAGSAQVTVRVIPRLHAEMADNLVADARFAARVQGVAAGIAAAGIAGATATPAPRGRRR